MIKTRKDLKRYLYIDKKSLGRIRKFPKYGYFVWKYDTY